MDKEFKPDVKKAVTLIFHAEHDEYMKTLENKSKYTRWLYDNDAGFQKFMKRRKWITKQSDYTDAN